MAKKLSIIMRCYNRLEYTIRSIASIDYYSGLSSDEYEIICVDQNSTDGTREWLRGVSAEKYYPVVPVLLNENIGDGLGMQVGIENADPLGYFFCQHDNDIEIKSENYFSNLISIYEKMEKKLDGKKRICALAGSHIQGINMNSAPVARFGKMRYPHDYHEVVYVEDKRFTLIPSAWVTGSLIFRRKFSSIKFSKEMVNSFCGHWWDNGYDNYICKEINFWHIDSDEKGGEYVKKQKDKFPSYSYVNLHYRKFLE